MSYLFQTWILFLLYLFLIFYFCFSVQSNFEIQEKIQMNWEKEFHLRFSAELDALKHNLDEAHIYLEKNTDVEDEELTSSDEYYQALIQEKISSANDQEETIDFPFTIFAFQQTNPSYPKNWPNWSISYE